MYEENQKRNKWGLGVIEQVIITSEEEMRGAHVTNVEKNKKPLTISKPVQNLQSLEVNEDD